MEHGEAEKHGKACLSEGGGVVHPRVIWGEDTEKVVMRRAKEIASNRQWVM